MLDWLVCRFAPRLPTLLDAPTPELPEPSPRERLEDRAREALAAAGRLTWTPGALTNPHRLLMGLGCRDLTTAEANQDPELAGRGPAYDPFPAFQPVEIPIEDGPTLTGRHSTGAPGAPVVIVVHGLFDAHNAFYVIEYAESLRRMGFHVVTLDLRDHGRLRGRPPVGSLGVHEGRDLLAAARTLARAEGVSVGLLGMSYGGHCAVRAAHEATLRGEADVLRGGVLAMGAPLDIHEAVLALDDWTRLPRPATFVDRVIHGQLLRMMQRHLRLRLAEHGHGARSDVYECFVREVILPAYPDQPPLVGAFLGTARACQAEVLARLAVPTLLVHSSDDPLVPVSHLHKARESAGDNPYVGTLEPPVGGHVCLGATDPRTTLELLATFFGRLRDG